MFKYCNVRFLVPYIGGDKYFNTDGLLSDINDGFRPPDFDVLIARSFATWATCFFSPQDESVTL